MNYAHPVTINIKTEKQTKEQVQQIAREIGVSLNALVNAYLKQLARTRSVTLSAQEAPSDRLVQSIRQAQRDRREGTGFHPCVETLQTRSRVICHLR